MPPRLRSSSSPSSDSTATTVDGTVTTVDGAPAGTTRFRFTPTDGLSADTRYRLVVSGLHDADGVAIPPASLVVRTVDAASVVRFRPRAGTADVARDATLSVRFTAPMDRKATAKAFTVTANGKPVAGTISWAEGGEVLVFKPSSSLPYKASVAMTVGATARSADGVPIEAAVTRPLPDGPEARRDTSIEGVRRRVRQRRWSAVAAAPAAERSAAAAGGRSRSTTSAS